MTMHLLIFACCFFVATTLFMIYVANYWCSRAKTAESRLERFVSLDRSGFDV